MCEVCGCGDVAHVHANEHTHAHEHQHDHAPEHTHTHTRLSPQQLHFGDGAAGTSAGGLSQPRLVILQQQVLGHNRTHAEANRKRWNEQRVCALNLVSSPGSGKTTLLAATITKLRDELPIAVIEGDQQTERDAERIRATGVEAVQINTGKGCHLDAHMIDAALQKLTAPQGGLLFIENVGNLVCPAEFDLGETQRVVILSVTEGEDKPLKYPNIFHNADVMILNKIDLLPYLQFNVDECIANAHKVNPNLKIFRLSATTGEGMSAWLDWLLTAVKFSQ